MIYDVKNVDFTYPGNTKKVLNKVSLRLDRGEVLSILGPNGAGKSTLLNCMTGLLKYDNGSINLEGSEISSLSARQVARTISYVPQTHIPAFSYTVLQFVTMGRAPHIGAMQKPRANDIEAAKDALRAISIEHLAEKPYTDISGGERQLAVIARALAQQPKAILFDEPTAHLDYGNQHRILRLIRALSEKGYGIIITTHNPDHALLLGGCVGILSKDGILDSGRCDEILTEERLNEVYKTKLRLIRIEELGRVVCLPINLADGEYYHDM